jgi:hypothetical protein
MGDKSYFNAAISLFKHIIVYNEIQIKLFYSTLSLNNGVESVKEIIYQTFLSPI